MRAEGSAVDIEKRTAWVSAGVFWAEAKERKLSVSVVAL